jgi:hypothetical protein
MWTKRQLLEEAFSECALQGYVFNVGPESLQGALRRMDSMLATWDAKGIRLGYALPSTPDASNIDGDSGLPDAANEAVFMNTAIRIAAGYGKTLSQDTRNTARAAYDVLLSRATYPPQQQLPVMPCGAGNKPGRTRRSFTPVPTDPLLAAQGGDQIDFE